MDIQSAAQIKQIKTCDLTPYARNARTHSESQISQIAASIQEFGFTNPVLVDGDGWIIAGHGRVMAAQLLGLDTVPTIDVGWLTDTQRRAYIIADNKLALNAGWDDDILRLELADLNDEGFELELLGFADDELSALSAGVDGGAGGPPKADTGIDYVEKFAVIVDCDGEANQREIFERLTDMGLTCKVLVN